MATGNEWREYFQSKSKPYLRKQLKLIDTATNKLDKKIVKEFQLDYLVSVSFIIRDILKQSPYN